ncbi:MAG: ABC transporter permease [Flavobacteriales bacterium CG_4_10_14_0_2_um_filter_32_8]|nr:MAG: ABC transporter permease [Flavobacteriales bacterium CG_4_10_14_0_2_um_filter_32_8]PJB14794.1 MAG: ABC transporter permease [Flavobacteriales bacterium CG_4_9_14_3_um_filter_32_8]
MNFIKSIVFRTKVKEEKALHLSNEREEFTGKENESYWRVVKKQFQKNKIAVWSLRIVYLFIIIAILADFLANEKPIAVKYNGNIYFPIFKEYVVDLGLSKWDKELVNVSWKELNYEWKILPLIPYLPKNIDFLNTSVSPFDEQQVISKKWKHWLGTDALGHDVLAGMIHGTRIALLVGIISMGIAALIGIFFGAIAGYYGDDQLKMSISSIILYSVGFVIALFYAFGARAYVLADALGNSFGNFLLELIISILLFLGILLVFQFFSFLLKKIPFLFQPITIPVDIIISRLIEVVVSIPRLFLIISIAAVVAKPSIFMVMMIIGLTTWTGIARFTRAELLRIRNLEYIEAAKALGYKEFRIIIKHALPNALSPILISIAFGIASAILIESTLSFIGIGVPAETITWGSLLAAARQDASAWWLAIFPGFAIFITVTIYNLIGEGLTDAMNPKLKQ